MDIAIKITLVASIILVGYSLSQALSSYESVCEKIDEIKAAVAETNSNRTAVKQSSLVMLSLLSSGYVLLLFFSGFAYEIVFGVALKLIGSIILSNRETDLIMKENSLSKSMYNLDRLDSFLNLFIGAFIALLLVL